MKNKTIRSLVALHNEIIRTIDVFDLWIAATIQHYYASKKCRVQLLGNGNIKILVHSKYTMIFNGVQFHITYYDIDLILINKNSKLIVELPKRIDVRDFDIDKLLADLWLDWKKFKTEGGVYAR